MPPPEYTWALQTTSTRPTPLASAKFNVTVWVDNAANLGGAQIYLEFNDTILSVGRWFEPKSDPAYIFAGRGTSALPTPPNDPGYQHLAPNKGRVLVSVSLFPPDPPYFTGTGKICIFEFQITAVPSEGKFTSPLTVNTAETFLLDGDTGGEVPGVLKEDGYYEISKFVAPPKQFTLTITAAAGGTTDPAPGAYVYLEGETVQVTAINSSGYVFHHWELNGTNIGSTNPVSIEMNANYNLRAVFRSAGMAGDVTGPDGVPDGKIDLYDVMLIARVFVSYGPNFLYPGSPPHPKWDERCDLNLDNAVDLKDLFIVWKNYGK
jgi:hypothetical protein